MITAFLSLAAWKYNRLCFCHLNKSTLNKMRLIHPDKNQLFTQIFFFFFFFFFAKCCQKSSYVVNWPPPEQLGAHFKILWELDTLKTNTKQIRLCTHISKELNMRVGEYGQSSESQNGCSFKIIFRLLSLHNGYWYM